MARLVRFSSYCDSVMPTMLTCEVDESHSHLLYLKMDCLLVAVSSVNFLVLEEVVEVVVEVVEVVLELLELELLVLELLELELELLELDFSQKLRLVLDYFAMLF